MSNIDPAHFEFPDYFIEHYVGDPWSRWRAGVAIAAMNLLTAPKCPGGVAVDYRTVSIRTLDRQTWPRVKGSGASMGLALRRNWREAACLAMDGTGLSAVEQKYGKEWVRHAVIRVTRSGDAEAGLLPEGTEFGTHLPYGEDDEYAGEQASRLLLYRTGPETLTEIVTPALFVPERGRLYVPPKTQVFQEHVPINRPNSWNGTFGAPVV